LIYGETRFLLTETDKWAYVRSWFGQHAIVVFNKSESESEFNFQVPTDVEGGIKPIIDEDRKVTRNNGEISLSLPKNSFEIIVIEK